ncbi:bile acid:sodium symporter family protein [Belliella sp. DSM 111904]|uniref:Bile acid:sodium symporter family protein n=1 Tax=Belliella filtrata TaxID=2923435 RepID=A0ABS9UVX1_9BACT|nr:bile acid:sodium symporter family protein [Belliella filtrata]MCH7408105.1 bile acid:sodium symporter family protein [Belliella filtrata]
MGDSKSNFFLKLGFGLAAFAMLACMVAWYLDGVVFSKLAAFMGFFVLTLTIRQIPTLKGYQYTAWILLAVLSGMLFPEQILNLGPIDLRNKWLILGVVQIVMFGMGVQMSLKDFSGLASTGRGVLVGIISQFSIMPILGYLLTQIFAFEPEIAAGIILMGACSSGLASNVMVYLAKANLVLSVTVTAIATLLAPILTPFWMKTLAGTLIDIRFMDMMIEIVKIVLVPIGAALLHDYLKHANKRNRQMIFLLALLSGLVLIVFVTGLWYYLSQIFTLAQMQSLEILSFFLGAICFGVVYHLVAKKVVRLDKLMPVLSMAGIVFFTTVTTAAGRDNLLQVGLMLFLASVIHNSLGYLFGYWFSRFLGLDIASSRAMALEVGLQNGGMASGLAGSMGKLGTVGLAPAVFSPWMNVSGSILANYWRRKREQMDE